LFDLEQIIFENFNISENNIISVELAKVLGYFSIMEPPSSAVVKILLTSTIYLWEGISLTFCFPESRSKEKEV
jgi:hypothetical protein